MATTISANTKLALISELITMQEGGWVLTNNSDDPGGWTYAGITGKVFEAFCNNRGIPFSFSELRRYPQQYDALVYQIYDELYWQPLHLEQFDAPLQGPLFSAGVNIGVEKAVLVLQKAINLFNRKNHCFTTELLVEDGHLGPITLTMIGNFKTRTYIFKDFFLREWMRHYIKLVVENAKAWRVFATEVAAIKPETLRASNLDGWFNRVEYWRN